MIRWPTLFTSILLMGFGIQANAVDYKLPDLNGNSQTLDQYLGKWIVINYWATWCATCLKELPELVALHEKHKGGDIVVLGINFESIQIDRLKSFVTQQAIPYPIWQSPVLASTPLGRVPALPATYIVDPDGRVVAGQVGIVSRQNLEDYIQGKKSTAY
jgi:peroxiredoxin